MKEAIKQLIRYNQIRQLYEKYERLLLPGTLVFGVIVDWVTFASINITTSFVLLGIYFAIAGGIILFLNAYDADRVSKRNIFRYLRLSSPLIIQFTFGALLSGSFIFYLFSGTLFVSWPFIVALVALMISNDVFRHYYLRPIVQISVYFFILFSLVSIALPFLFNTISAWVFVLGSVVSILLIYGYVALLGLVTSQTREERLHVMLAIGGIFACIHGLYFLNIIPPIPLSLREAVVAHTVERIGTAYRVVVEEESFLDRLIPGTTIHNAPGKVSVYTAIFAPGELNTTIVHHWQKYDEVQKEWVTRDTLSFMITGGAKMGYRGFSVKSHVEPGRWRVDVETKRGQVLGRVRFRAEPSDTNTVLDTIIK